MAAAASTPTAPATPRLARGPERHGRALVPARRELREGGTQLIVGAGGQSQFQPVLQLPGGKPALDGRVAQPACHQLPIEI